jgi:hypothetical protein
LPNDWRAKAETETKVVRETRSLAETNREKTNRSERNLEERSHEEKNHGVKSRGKKNLGEKKHGEKNRGGDASRVQRLSSQKQCVRKDRSANGPQWMKYASASRAKELLLQAMQVLARRHGALSPNLEALKNQLREPKLRKRRRPDMTPPVRSR